MEPTELNKLRDDIAVLDESIVKLVAERMQLAEKIGQHKINHNLIIKAYDVEKNVISRYENLGNKHGISKKLATELSKMMIDQACKVQEKKKLANVARSYQKVNSPGNALVAGGFGNMGRWFCNFLQSFGYNVYIADTQPNPPNQTGWQTVDLSSFVKKSSEKDLIAICTPIETTSKVLKEITKIGTKSLVFDVCSLKSPILENLKNAQNKLPGLVSIHPMFGPDVDLLVGENILICDIGNADATKKAINLFSQTTANIYETSPENHDELMSQILGLSHFTNLLFSLTLAKSKVDINELIHAKSTTFNKQLKVALDVCSENPELYFDIQRLNAYTPTLYQNLRASLEELSSFVLLNERTKFSDLMVNLKTRCEALSDKS